MPVVGVFICDFVIDGMPKRPLVRCCIADEESGTMVIRDVRMAFVQLPLFEKTEEECETGLDMWIYNLRNMEKLDTLPFAEYRDQIFKRLEKVTNYASLTPKEQAEYDEDWKWAADYNETVLYKFDQGIQQGIQQGLVEGKLQNALKTAQKMYEKGYSIEEISEITELPVSELEKKFKN